jgi:hypothetical protein
LCIIKPRDNFTVVAKVVNIWYEERWSDRRLEKTT